MASSNKVGNVASTTIKLHNREITGSTWEHPGIATVTFCEGDPKATLAKLKTNVTTVVEANPWIAGRITEEKTLEFASPAPAGIVDKLLFEQRAEVPSRTMEYSKLVACVKSPSLTVQQGATMIKTGVPITKLVVCPGANGEAEFGASP